MAKQNIDTLYQELEQYRQDAARGNWYLEQVAKTMGIDLEEMKEEIDFAMQQERGVLH